MIKKQLNILVSPLEWGLGHSTRMIPIIHKLKEDGHNVMYAGGRQAVALLKKEFPDLDWFPMPSCAINYPSKGSFLFSILKQLPSFFANIYRERRKIEKLIKDHKIDVVISDNRYGLYSKNAYCIFVTHQLMIKLPDSIKQFEGLVHKFHRRFINKFNKCWIPDYPCKPFLSGDLSHKYEIKQNIKFIGPLSRFQTLDCIPNNTNYDYDVIIVLSGPEPKRTIFENKLINELKDLSYKVLLIRGIPTGSDEMYNIDNIIVYNHLESCKLKEHILKSKLIVCRSGYSSIMDLVALKRTALLVPTPGQTEQEYLADFFSGMKLFLCISEQNLNLKEALSQLSLYSWKVNFPDNKLLEKELQDLSKIINK